MSRRKIKIAVFGSFYSGYYVLDELLYGPFKEHFKVVGVATDDVREPFVSSEVRVWQYPHLPEEELLVESRSSQLGLPFYKGRVKSEVFYKIYEQVWSPEMCLMATFGQRVDARIYSFPCLGFFNIHPCIEDGWPSKYAGPNPFQALMNDGHDHTRAALHKVDAGFDTGQLVAMSSRVAIPPSATVVDMHKISSPMFAGFAVYELARLAGVAV